MNAITLALACSLLVAGAHCANVYAFGVPLGHQTVVHTPVVHTAPVVHAPVVHSAGVVHQTVVRRPSVTHHHEVVHVPHHEFGYSVEHTKVVQPKSTVVHHHPLTGLPYQQTDIHHTPLVTGSRSSVHQSRTWIPPSQDQDHRRVDIPAPVT
ncbi:hypothetical protein MTO96_036365 [Rhipicephalus appendiculatus]